MTKKQRTTSLKISVPKFAVNEPAVPLSYADIAQPKSASTPKKKNAKVQQKTPKSAPSVKLFSPLLPDEHCVTTLDSDEEESKSATNKNCETPAASPKPKKKKKKENPFPSLVPEPPSPTPSPTKHSYSEKAKKVIASEKRQVAPKRQQQEAFPPLSPTTSLASSSNEDCVQEDATSPVSTSSSSSSSFSDAIKSCKSPLPISPGPTKVVFAQIPKPGYPIKYLPMAVLEQVKEARLYFDCKAQSSDNPELTYTHHSPLPATPTRVYPAFPFLGQNVYQDADCYYKIHNLNFDLIAKHQQVGDIPPSKFERQISMVDRLIDEITQVQSKGDIKPLVSSEGILPGYVYNCFVPFGNHGTDFTRVIQGKYRPCIVLLAKSQHSVVLSMQDYSDQDRSFASQHHQYMITIDSGYDIERLHGEDNKLLKHQHKVHVANLHCIPNYLLKQEIRYGRVKNAVLLHFHTKLKKYIQNKCS